MIIIVKAGQNHLPGILEIENASFAAPWSPGGMMAELESSDVRFFVAMDGETVAGFGILHCFGDEAEIFNLAVRPDRRSQGIGRMLLGELCRAADSGGVRNIYLEVRESNAAARGLYTKFGFRNIGRRKNYYDSPREDALLMVRQRPLPENQA